MGSSYHVPVLATEVLEFIISDKSGVYVDCTLGGGGHSRILAEHLNKNAKLIGIDQDQDAIKAAKKELSDFNNTEFIIDNYKNVKKILSDLGIGKINGLLLDLGVSSFQIDTDNRGFSYSTDSALDMRMNKLSEFTAADILNQYSSKDLAQIFFKYGEEKKSRIITNHIIKEREKGPFVSSLQLKNIIDKVIHPKFRIKSYARIFQALRIEVNHELENLEIVLQDSLKILKKGGRLLVISYHSLEDRIVKRFLKYWEDPCECPKEIPVCICGKTPQLKIISTKAIKASAAEIKNNNRARSAILRVGEKI